MSNQQQITLAMHFGLQLQASYNMRTDAEAIFGENLELANSLLIDDVIIASKNLTFENHFRHMARQHQRLLRAELIGRMQGLVHDGIDLERYREGDVLETVDDNGNPIRLEWKPDRHLRSICPGYALSIGRLLVILVPLIVLALLTTLTNNIPATWLAVILRKRPHTWLARIAQRNVNASSLQTEALIDRLEELLGGREGDPYQGVVIPEKKHARLARVMRVEMVEDLPVGGRYVPNQSLEVYHVPSQYDGAKIV